MKLIVRSVPCPEAGNARTGSAGQSIFACGIVRAPVEAAVFTLSGNQPRPAPGANARAFHTLAFVYLTADPVNVLPLRVPVLPVAPRQFLNDTVDLPGGQAGGSPAACDRPEQVPGIDDRKRRVYATQPCAACKDDDGMVDFPPVFREDVPQSTYMALVLFYRVPEPVLPAVDVLRPILRGFAPADIPFEVFGLYNEDPEPRNDEVVYLAARIPVHDQKAVDDPVFFGVESGQLPGHPPFPDMAFDPRCVAPEHPKRCQDDCDYIDVHISFTFPGTVFFRSVRRLHAGSGPPLRRPCAACRPRYDPYIPWPPP